MCYTIQRLTSHFAARIDGLNLASQSNQQTAEQVQNLLDTYRVLVFPKQNLTAEQLRDLVAYFGPLFHHHSDEGVLYADGVPEVLEMRKEPDGTRLFGGSDWHADVTFRKPAGYLSALQAVELPPEGGDTAFANGIRAFSALSSSLQDLLRTLNAVHSYNGAGVPDHPTETAVHPIVRKDPRTGEEGLYINRMFAVRIDGMTEDESRPLIQFLSDLVARPEFTCRVTWEPGQLVMWDNRFTLHYPINDFSGHLRLLLRCTAMEE
ncbi:MAG: TauD/TfdA family dioxygenase [Pseudomonadota bacterium]